MVKQIGRSVKLLVYLPHNLTERALGIMRSRVLTAVAILVALSLSAWGNVLAAALCSRLISDQACCARQIKHQSQTHHKPHMDHANRSLEDESSSCHISTLIPVERWPEQRVAANALCDLSTTCSHCASHSRLPQTTLALRRAESAKRYAELAAVHISQIIFLPVLRASIIDPREHAPPGKTSSSHLLLNVFLI